MKRTKEDILQLLEKGTDSMANIISGRLNAYVEMLEEKYSEGSGLEHDESIELFNNYIDDCIYIIEEYKRGFNNGINKAKEYEEELKFTVRERTKKKFTVIKGDE